MLVLRHDGSCLQDLMGGRIVRIRSLYQSLQSKLPCCQISKSLMGQRTFVHTRKFPRFHVGTIVSAFEIFHFSPKKKGSVLYADIEANRGCIDAWSKVLDPRYFQKCLGIGMAQCLCLNRTLCQGQIFRFKVRDIDQSINLCSLEVPLSNMRKSQE